MCTPITNLNNLKWMIHYLKIEMTDKILLFRRPSLYNLSIKELLEHIRKLQDYISKFEDSNFKWKWEECNSCDKWGDFGDHNMCGDCARKLREKHKRFIII